MPRRRWESARQEPSIRDRDGKRLSAVGGRHCVCEGAAHRLGLAHWRRALGGHQVAAPSSPTASHFNADCPHSLLRATTTERRRRPVRARVHVRRLLIA